MKHSYYCKMVGSLSPELMQNIKNFCLSTVYVWTEGDDFAPNLLDNAFMPSELIEQYLNEMAVFFNKNGHIKSNIARMHPKSYLREHSDFSTVYGDKSRFLNSIKIQIPVITNSQVIMMWTEGIGKFHVEHLEEGGIYIFDNIVKHCVVNGSDTFRYNITARYTSDSALDKTVL